MRGRHACATALASITAMAWLVAPARAATPLEVIALGLQPCPEYRVVKSRAHTAAEQQTAAQGTFEPMAGYPVELEPPVDWQQDPYANQSWVDYVHAMAWIDPLLYSYVHGGDLSALAKARALLLDWIAANPRGGSQTSERAWLDKSVGDRAGYLGFITRAAACEGLLSSEAAETLIDAMRDHAAFLADPVNYAPNNHGLFADMGLALLGYYGAFLPEAGGWVAQAQERFDQTLHGRLSEKDALWLEHSNGYQFLAIRLLDRFSTALGAEPYAQLLARMREAAGWLVTPAGRQAPTGDSREKSPLPSWALDEAADDSGMRVMWEAGQAIIKRRGGFLQITAGFHNRTHKHADDLGFHLFDRGRDVISDSGIYHYDPDKWRGFSRSTQAHSVLTVDGKQFPNYDPERAYGSGLLAAGSARGWYAVEGRNPTLGAQGVRHRRVFLYRPGRMLLVFDRVRSRSRHTYRRNFQVAASIRARRAQGGLALRSGGFSGSLRDHGGGSRLRTVKGRLDPPGGWSFPSFRERVPRSTAIFRSRARNANYLTAIGLRGPVKVSLRKVGRNRFSVVVRRGRARPATDLSVKRSGSRLFVRAKRRR